METDFFLAGTQLFAQGDYSEKAYRILEGSVEISINEGQSKVVLATLEAGTFFGEMGMIEHMPRSATAHALTELTVEVITEQHFNESLSRGGDLLVPYFTTIFERLRGANEGLRETHEQLADLEQPAPISKQPVRQPSSSDECQLMLEPDSDETRAQSALQSQALTSFPFALGRRADLAACVDVFSKGHLLIGDRMPFRVSRSHCVIERDQDAYFVQDLGSKLGTIVNGISLGLDSKERRVRLQPGVNTLLLGPANTSICFILTVPTATR